MTTEDLEQELRAANANRAILYYLIVDELRRAHGEVEATNIMKAAIYRRGVEMARPIRQFAPDRVKEVGEYSVANSAGGGKIFNPEGERLDDEGFDVLNTTCPLKEAWQAYGLSDAEVAKMCDIGSAKSHPHAHAEHNGAVAAGPVGASERCGNRLFQTRQTYRQRPHRSLQRPSAGGMPQRLLVPLTDRCPGPA
jgi:hypothetical protein